MWKVLIADDESFVREGLKNLISWEELGYVLKGSYKNGREILEAIPEKRPDIVILDIQMPILNGLDTARIISDKWPDIAVILLTAYGEFQYAKQAIEYHVKYYVVKSSVLEELPEVLKKMAGQLIKKHSVDKYGEIFDFLLRESEYLDSDMEGDEIYQWYKEKFHEFRLAVIRSDLAGIGEERLTARKRMMNEIMAAFSEEKIQVRDISMTEYALLMSGAGEENELMEKFRNLCRSYSMCGRELLVGVSKIYHEITMVSEAYRTVVTYLDSHFLDWEEGNTGVVFTGDRPETAKEELSPIVERLVKLMESGDTKGFILEIQVLCKTARNSPEIRIRSAWLLLLENCRRVCREHGKSLEEMTGADADGLNDEILRGTRMSELEQQLSDVIVDAVEQIHQRAGKEDGLVEKIKAYVDKNYCRKLTLDDIAGAVFVNRSYVSRLYKQKTGENLYDVINRKKVGQARKYIEEGSKKIGEIGVLVGIEDNAYFSKVFKKYTGCSPKEYERIVRERKEERQ